MGDNIRLCNDKFGSKCDVIKTQTQYGKETLLNISKTVQKDFRLKILGPNTIKNIWKNWLNKRTKRSGKMRRLCQH